MTVPDDAMATPSDPAPQNAPFPVNSNAQATYAPAPMEIEVTRLMSAAKQDEPGAFDQLVETLRGRAYMVAHGLVGSREDALDMAQEAFLKTYRARQTFRDGEPFLPWFHRILRNTCFSFLRKRGRLKRTSLSGDPDDDRGDWEIADDGPPPSEGLERADLQQAFWKAFNGLGARDREIISMRHFDELSYREIADALGVPIGTVMSRLFHARKRMRVRLAPHVPAELIAEASSPDSRASR